MYAPGGPHRLPAQERYPFQSLPLLSPPKAPLGHPPLVHPTRFHGPSSSARGHLPIPPPIAHGHLEAAESPPLSDDLISDWAGDACPTELSTLGPDSAEMAAHISLNDESG